jgi:hypothetical protein
MLHLRLLAPIGQATRQRIRQAQTLIARFEQHRTTIGAAVRLVEACHHRLTEQVLEDDRLSYGIVSHVKASCVWKNSSGNDFLRQWRPSFLPRS